MSIVRIGLGETKNFAEGYAAIFGKKDSDKKDSDKPTKKPAKKAPAAKKKTSKKK